MSFNFRRKEEKRKAQLETRAAFQEKERKKLKLVDIQAEYAEDLTFRESVPRLDESPLQHLSDAWKRIAAAQFSEITRKSMHVVVATEFLLENLSWFRQLAQGTESHIAFVVPMAVVYELAQLSFSDDKLTATQAAEILSLLQTCVAKRTSPVILQQQFEFMQVPADVLAEMNCQDFVLNCARYLQLTLEPRCAVSVLASAHSQLAAQASDVGIGVWTVPPSSIAPTLCTPVPKTARAVSPVPAPKLEIPATPKLVAVTPVSHSAAGDVACAPVAATVAASSVPSAASVSVHSPHTALAAKVLKLTQSAAKAVKAAKAGQQVQVAPTRKLPSFNPFNVLSPLSGRATDCAFSGLTVNCIQLFGAPPLLLHDLHRSAIIIPSEPPRMLMLAALVKRQREAGLQDASVIANSWLQRFQDDDEASLVEALQEFNAKYQPTCRWTEPPKTNAMIITQLKLNEQLRSPPCFDAVPKKAVLRQIHLMLFADKKPHTAAAIRSMLLTYIANPVPPEYSHRILCELEASGWLEQVTSRRATEESWVLRRIQ
eukprot:TRINITY_DN12656_c0_g1_i1.p1 TRINITY_DN12656_c0_g1~~TRINITY_DN12656_c0_g1_i1.p1  ORF type:complete len:543 (-),score=107.33 TRINITY_DN12656_c0_g1_i1:119-1747(-)